MNLFGSLSAAGPSPLMVNMPIDIFILMLLVLNCALQTLKLCTLEF